ncbi:MAG: TIGR00269 family protein [Chloroflexi bacterium]|nr:TIGR00269 family protein [Chloroflexota bacterium]
MKKRQTQARVPRCKKCGAPAVIYMRQHRLALCETHFQEWFVNYTQRTIEKYHMFGPEDRVLVAVSGGKDSLALWDVLTQLGYRADGLYIGLGIDEGTQYSQRSLEAVRGFMAERPGLRLYVVDMKEAYGETIPELARRVRRGRGKPCSVCGLSKRHIMNELALREGFDVLVTGHNLDDEAAVLFQNTLRWQTGYLARQSPVLEATHPGLVRKAKPFCRFYEREVAAYAIVRGIEYQYDECPFSVGATTIYYKELLNQLERHSPGSKFQFYTQFLKAKKKGLITFHEPEGEVVLRPCRICGQPTTAGEICAFCRMWVRPDMDLEEAKRSVPSLTFRVETSESEEG